MINNSCNSCQRDGTFVELAMEVETRTAVTGIATSFTAVRTVQPISYIPMSTESIRSVFCPNCGLTYSTLVMGR